MLFKIALIMAAFAANSVLCRLALVSRHIDPMTFSLIRVASGAVVLFGLFLYSKSSQIKVQWSLKNAFFLAVYILAFSYAYLQIDAGIGALLLFGAVQLIMMLYGYWQGDQIGIYRGIGLCIALAGISVLLLPGTHAPDWGYALIMVISGLAWAGYSIAGRNMTQPIGSTLANFTLAVPMVLLANVLLAQDRYIDVQGWILAILSGGVTSSGAYVLWYAILKHIDRVTASTVQLSVPCLAIIGGSLFVNESVTGRVILSSFMVLFGILLVIYVRPQKAKNA
ncbi:MULTISPECIES: DMT family transporter [unclassified Acinetobacter]|uniref:DMT family transporter n=1 Tax=unclassified Acinetobacter TaxID=196816 RepID=UPI00287D5AEB|nr:MULTISPECIES: DMT family transporter [unclassified Acinetobacter]MDS7956662.1 DMT family transporter [Acinetobacter sp. V104_13]MDS7984448.1 DMT family transporter [Acinetobacter sp. V104_3]